MLGFLGISHGLVHIWHINLSSLLPFIRSEFNLSYAFIGVITSCITFAAAIGIILASTFSDRINGITSILGMFVLVGSLAFLLSLVQNLFFVLVLLLSMGALIAIFHPFALADISQLHSELRGTVFGVFEASGMIGMALAPAVAMLIASKFDWRYVYTFWAFPYIGIGVFGLMMFKKTRKGNHRVLKIKAVLKKLRYDLHSLLLNRPMKGIYFIHSLIAFIFAGSLTFIPMFLVDIKRVDMKLCGYMFTVFLMAGMGGQIIGGRLADRLKKNKLIAISLLLIVPLFILIPFCEKEILWILLGVCGIIFFMARPCIFALTGDIKKDHLGFAFGIQVFIGTGTGALSRLFCGVISEIWGVQNIFFIFAFVALVGGFVSFLKLP